MKKVKIIIKNRHFYSFECIENNSYELIIEDVKNIYFDKIKD